MTAIAPNVKFVSVHRLGKFDKERVKDNPRPLKVVLSSRADRDVVMTNATKLAGTRLI